MLSRRSAVVLLVLSSGLARAQEGTYGGRSGAQLVQRTDDPALAQPQTIVTPPVVTHDEGAIYPSQAIKDGVREPAEVVLIVDVDAQGKVQNARIDKGAGHGFDEAAIEAARKLELKPAMRDGKPIASKIRHRYVFNPPPSRLIGRVLTGDNQPISGATVRLLRMPHRSVVQETKTDAAGSYAIEDVPFGSYVIDVASALARTTALQEVGPGEEVTATFRLGGAAPAPEGEEVEEVTVRGARPPREVTKRTLDQRELLHAPGTNGDALRALQNLPGIARPPGFAGILIVRGSSPQDTNIFVDGTLIPLVYHFGGLSSVVPTEMLSKIDFYPGNFSTQYGRAMGGIVDVGIRDPKTDKIHGLAQADLIDARLLVEGPIDFLGKGWSFAVAGRRSHVDVWLKPVLEALGTGVTTAPVYYDWQMVLKKELDARTNARLLFLGSDDRIDILVKNLSATAPAVGGDLSAHTGFWRFQGRLDSKLDKKTELRVTAAAGEDLIDFTFGDLFFNIQAYPITMRAELTSKLSRGITFNVGIDELASVIDATVRAPAPTRAGEPPPGPIFLRPTRTAVDHNAIHRPGLYAELELGAWRGARIVPGLRLDYWKDIKTMDLSPRVTVRQDVGPKFPRTTIKGGVGVFMQPPLPQESNAVFGQVGLVSERAVHYSLGVERELTRQIDLSVEGFYKQLDRLVSTGAGNGATGRVIGLEALLRYKPDEKFFGWIAYTLSRSTRTVTPYLPETLAAFDQTHILTILGSYRLGAGWELGARYRLVSGNPFTPSTYGFYDANAATYLALTGFPVNSARLPLFHQLDLRIDKTWKFKEWQLTAYADIVNVYNAGNVEAIQYNYNHTRQSYVTGLPILPSLGLRGEF
jgi:TonB family protein